jgi:hypothetical protein
VQQGASIRSKRVRSKSSTSKILKEARGRRVGYGVTYEYILPLRYCLIAIRAEMVATTFTILLKQMRKSHIHKVQFECSLSESLS